MHSSNTYIYIFLLFSLTLLFFSPFWTYILFYSHHQSYKFVVYMHSLFTTHVYLQCTLYFTTLSVSLFNFVVYTLLVVAYISPIHTFYSTNCYDNFLLYLSIRFAEKNKLVAKTKHQTNCDLLSSLKVQFVFFIKSRDQTFVWNQISSNYSSSFRIFFDSIWKLCSPKI